MKTTSRVATLLACLTALVFSATSAQAQGQGQPPSRSRGNIAVIDISKIFKEHQRFRSQLEFMKKDVDAAEATLKRERDEIRKMAEEMQQRYKVGTPDYKRMEEQIATRSSNLQLRMNLQKRDFMEKEANIYFHVYKEVETEVTNFARPRGIDLVLRYNDIEMKNSENRQEILAGVNKAVVYHNNIDITYDILERLNRPEPPQNAGGQYPAANRGLIPGQN